MGREPNGKKRESGHTNEAQPGEREREREREREEQGWRERSQEETA